jgi:NAD(P)-dependent dehydrogenase (short-subunit alcohol dehydrogenase family)
MAPSKASPSSTSPQQQRPKKQPRWGPLSYIIFTLLIVAFVMYFFQKARPNRYSSVDMSDKIVLITGANTGLGFESALQLFLQNATVVMSARDRSRLNNAIERIEKSRPQGCVGKIDGDLPLLDLSSLRSVEVFAAAFSAKYNSLDVLLLNAGIMAVPFSLTIDGFESTMHTNHISHQHLTELLLPKLSLAGKETKDARIVIVSSSAMLSGDLGPEAMKDLNFKSRPYLYSLPSFVPALPMMKSYGQSKLANALQALELANRPSLRESNVRAFSCQPGPVNTELFRYIPFISSSDFMEVAMSLFAKTPKQGAQAQLYLVTAPIEKLSKHNGNFYWDPDMPISSFLTFIKPQAVDASLANELYEKTNELISNAAAKRL